MDPTATTLQRLKQRRLESASANRKDLIAETNLVRQSNSNQAKLERKRKQLEDLAQKEDAAITGEDLERKRNWDYSIEDNENWDKKLALKGRRADFSFTDYDDIARRKYKKDLDLLKPDLQAYNAQRLAATGSTSSALIASSLAAGGGAEYNQDKADDLYRDANSFIYADHKPSEDAIDKVIGKINLDLDKRSKRSRVRKNEVEGDITYINEKNKVFNKKLARFYDAHTQETRDAFERGTAL